MSGYTTGNDPEGSGSVRARGSIGPDWGNPYSKSARVPPAGRRKYDRKLAQFRPDPEPVPASDIARVGLP